MRPRILVLALMAAVSVLASGRKDEELAQLTTRAQSAPVGQQPSLYVEIAERRLKSANQFYTAGKVAEATAEVSEVVSSADKASDAAIRSGKHLKDTEIYMRKMADKLRDIKRILTFDDQAPVQDAADHLESLRTRLLARMFKGKK